MDNPGVVAITGAATGIGRAMALEFLEKGSRVIGFDLDEAGLAELAREQDRFHGYRADVTRESELATAAREAAARHGRPDIWINNAGIAILGSFEQLTSEEFDRVIRVDFHGVVYGTRVALALMSKPAHGTIVNVASVSGVCPMPYMGAYTSAKHAVVGFTRALREELRLARSPIRLVLVSPGFVRTKIMEPQRGFAIPKWMEWMVAPPEGAAREIVAGVLAGREELTPTWNGKLFQSLSRLAPGALRSTAKLVVAKDWKELLGLTPIRPGSEDSRE